jgi:hypothetical protein
MGWFVLPKLLKKQVKHYNSRDIKALENTSLLVGNRFDLCTKHNASGF